MLLLSSAGCVSLQSMNVAHLVWRKWLCSHFVGCFSGARLSAEGRPSTARVPPEGPPSTARKAFAGRTIWRLRELGCEQLPANRRPQRYTFFGPLSFFETLLVFVYIYSTYIHLYIYIFVFAESWNSRRNNFSNLLSVHAMRDKISQLFCLQKNACKNNSTDNNRGVCVCVCVLVCHRSIHKLWLHRK